MQLDNEDRNYFDEHFKDTHEKINKNGKAIVRLETAFNGHKDNPCPNMVFHYNGDHKGLIGKIILILVSALGFLFAIFKYFYG